MFVAEKVLLLLVISLTANQLFQHYSICTLLGDKRLQTTVHHDDVVKWQHFPRYWPFVRGIHRWPVDSPYKGQWRGALIFSLICAWTNSSANNRDAASLRSHCNGNAASFWAYCQGCYVIVQLDQFVTPMNCCFGRGLSTNDPWMEISMAWCKKVQP